MVPPLKKMFPSPPATINSWQFLRVECGVLTSPQWSLTACINLYPWCSVLCPVLGRNHSCSELPSATAMPYLEDRTPPSLWLLFSVLWWCSLGLGWVGRLTCLQQNIQYPLILSTLSSCKSLQWPSSPERCFSDLGWEQRHPVAIARVSEGRGRV